MNTLISKSKSDYLHQLPQDYLHKETTDWLSEIEFLKTELVFLNKLFNKTFLRLKSVQRIKALTTLDKKAKSFQSKILKELHDKVIRHEQHLEALDENMFSQSELPGKRTDKKS